MSKCKKDGNQLRVLMARGKKGNLLSETYLRWCDECDTIYILKPELLEPVELEFPLLEYATLQMKVTQIEVL